MEGPKESKINLRQGKIYCGYCGNTVASIATICPACGVQVGTGNRFCPLCGTSRKNPAAVVCTYCGIDFREFYKRMLPSSYTSDTVSSEKGVVVLGRFACLSLVLFALASSPPLLFRVIFGIAAVILGSIGMARKEKLSWLGFLGGLSIILREIGSLLKELGRIFGGF